MANLHNTKALPAGLKRPCSQSRKVATGVSISTAAINQPADIATLRLLMDQYQLGTADIPEIGSKSMVSRVLSGERSMNKNHIKALAERFQISPNLFF